MKQKLRRKEFQRNMYTLINPVFEVLLYTLVVEAGAEKLI